MENVASKKGVAGEGGVAKVDFGLDIVVELGTFRGQTWETKVLAGTVLGLIKSIP